MGKKTLIEFDHNHAESVVETLTPIYLRRYLLRPSREDVENLAAVGIRIVSPPDDLPELAEAWHPMPVTRHAK